MNGKNDCLFQVGTYTAAHAHGGIYVAWIGMYKWDHFMLTFCMLVLLQNSPDEHLGLYALAH